MTQQNGKLIQLKASEIKELKESLLAKNNGICPICGKTISSDDAVLDHTHRLNKRQTPGENGYGLVRGAICRNCNLVEGKLANALRRYSGISQVEDKVIFLERLIEYYKTAKTNYIHPFEKMPVKNISKRQYNKLKKACNKKIPDYPKSGKLTKALAKLFDEFGISPYVG